MHNVLSSLEHLPPEAQGEVATYIKALVEALTHRSPMYTSIEDVPSEETTNVQWQDPFGAWGDLPDTMLDELDQLRHGSQPTPLLELL